MADTTIKSACATMASWCGAGPRTLRRHSLWLTATVTSRSLFNNKETKTDVYVFRCGCRSREKLTTTFLGPCYRSRQVILYATGASRGKTSSLYSFLNKVPCSPLTEIDQTL